MELVGWFIGWLVSYVASSRTVCLLLVMLGNRDGIYKLINDEFPSVIVWHFINHRRAFSTSDIIVIVSEINIFILLSYKVYIL